MYIPRTTGTEQKTEPLKSIAICQAPTDPDPQFIAPVNTHIRYAQVNQAAKQPDTAKFLNEQALLTPTFIQNGAVNDLNQPVHHLFAKARHKQASTGASSQVQLTIKDIINRSDYVSVPVEPASKEYQRVLDKYKQSGVTVNTNSVLVQSMTNDKSIERVAGDDVGPAAAARASVIQSSLAKNSSSSPSASKIGKSDNLRQRVRKAGHKGLKVDELGAFANEVQQ